MAQGIKLPAQIKNGRLVTISGDDYIQQLVETGLTGGESTNPFQDVGLGEWMIFDINDKMTHGKIRRRVIMIFASLEADQLARLDDPAEHVAFRKDTGEESSTLWLDIQYTNLETQERRELSVPVPPEE